MTAFSNFDVMITPLKFINKKKRFFAISAPIAEYSHLGLLVKEASLCVRKMTKIKGFSGWFFLKQSFIEITTWAYMIIVSVADNFRF